jgi:hypothetical protein
VSVQAEARDQGREEAEAPRDENREGEGMKPLKGVIYIIPLGNTRRSRRRADHPFSLGE